MPLTERLAQAFATLVLARPRLVLVVCLLCTAALGWQARLFRIDAGADTLLTRDNRVYVETQIVDRRFAAQEFMLVAYRPRDFPLLSGQSLDELRGLRRALRQLPRVESVRSILDVPLIPPGVRAEDTDLSAWTLDRRNFSQKELRQALHGHPIYQDLLVNKDHSATAMQVLFRKDPGLEAIDRRRTELQAAALERTLTTTESDELAQLQRKAEPLEHALADMRVTELQAVRDLAADYQDHADIYLGGVHVLGQQLIQIITRDLWVFGGAIVLMVCALLFLLFRGLRWVVIPVVCCACSVLATLGLFGLLGFKATVISSSFIALQLILTLAISIHLIVQYREYSAAHPGWSQAERVRRTLLRKAAPCFYAGFINIVGFASLLFSTLQPVKDFGWMMSLAMVFSIVTSLILFPALMAMTRSEPVRPRRNLSHYLLDFSAALAQARPRAIVGVSAAVLLAGAAGLALLDVENSFINYFRARTPVHRELSYIDREFGGTTPLDITYTLPAGGPRDLVLSAAEVETLQRIQQSLKQHEAVGKILSVVNFTELARRFNGGKPLTEYELTALYLTLERNLRNDLLGSFFSPAARQLRFSVRIQDTTPGLNRAELLAGIHDDLRRLGIPDQQVKLTSLFVMYQDILQQLYRSQILTLGASFGVLALAVLLIFRSARVTLICITPNLLSTVVVLGLMGWTGIPLDFMTIMIAAIAMGITVDDTIHYIDRYLEELRKGPGAGTVARTHTSVGYALLYTSLIVILGFALLAFSDFVPSVLFGLLTGLSMALAVLFNLTLLPVLLDRFVGREAQAARHSHSGSGAAPATQ